MKRIFPSQHQLRILLFSLCWLLLIGHAQAHPLNTKLAFKHFIHTIKKEAMQEGVSLKTLNSYLNPLHVPKPRLISKVKHMHHRKVPYTHYLHQFIKTKDVSFGVKQLQRHHTLLSEISQKFQVPEQIVVALWGIESNYGRYIGKSNLIQSLATLSFQHIRSDFYRQQLIDALKVLDTEKLNSKKIVSSWDGGMGQAQFMPQAYLNFAIDYNQKGYSNIWTYLPDVFASIANYLSEHGWHYNEPSYIKIKLPKSFPLALADKDIRKPLNHWKKLGIHLPKHTKINPSSLSAIIAPNGLKGPAYLALNNFFVLLKWNNSANEGLATCYLAKYFKQHAHHSHRPLQLGSL